MKLCDMHVQCSVDTQDAVDEENPSIFERQPLGSNHRVRPDFSQPNNLKHVVVLHVIEFFGACFCQSIMAHRFSRWRGVNLLFGDERFLRKWTEWRSMDVFTFRRSTISVFTVLLTFVHLFIKPFVVIVIQHAYFHHSNCPGTFVLIGEIFHFTVVDLPSCSLVRGWQLHFHVCCNQ